MTEKIISWKKISAVSIVAILLFVGSFQTGFITHTYTKIYSDAVFSISPGWGLWIFTFFYFYFSFLILWKLHNTYKISSTYEEKAQFKLIGIGALISLTVTALSSFVLPFFSIFVFAGVDGIGFLIFLTFIAYSITKHHLFSIRVITIELMAFGLWTFILVRTLLAETMREVLIEGGLLVITIIFGISLIRSTLHGIIQREKIEKLAEDLRVSYDSLQDMNEHLEQKVAEQTKEVRTAYDVEKKARLELKNLNDLKGRFITSTQHHLRTPLTALAWQLESIRDGAHGPVGTELSQALDTADESVCQLRDIIEDFIDITGEQKV